MLLRVSAGVAPHACSLVSSFREKGAEVHLYAVMEVAEKGRICFCRGFVKKKKKNVVLSLGGHFPSLNRLFLPPSN